MCVSWPRRIATCSRGLRTISFVGTYFTAWQSLVDLGSPPLRERKSDILPIADSFLAKINARSLRTRSPNTARKRLSEPAYRKLNEYNWPGNIRQLKNVLIRLPRLLSCRE